MSYRVSSRTAHAGLHAPVPEIRPHAPPLYQTTGFEYEGAAQAEAAAEGRGYLYARDGSPTEDALAQAVADLEGAEASVPFASGMAAIAAALEAYLEPEGHLVSVAGLYGGTHELIAGVLPKFGVRHSFVDAPTAQAIARAIEPKTRAVYVESISNPLLRVAELDAIGALCRERGVPLLVDATFATPLVQRPLAFGATLSIHSGTKYLGGHGDVMCGVVSGAATEIEKVQRLRKLHGACLDPFGAWLVLRGMRTLSLRVDRQIASAGLVARALEELGVERVFYPGLASHPDHALAARVLDGPGAMVSFEVAGGLDGARRVYDRVRLIARAASLGDVASLLTHPARFSHLHVGEDERRRAGITDGLLRLSVGIEDPRDLIEDLRDAIG
ncbi:MAG: trans-sulfuration enzyme family protein [Polyangia bacterium]